MLQKTIFSRKNQKWIYINKNVRISQKYWRWFSYENIPIILTPEKEKLKILKN